MPLAHDSLRSRNELQEFAHGASDVDQVEMVRQIYNQVSAHGPQNIPWHGIKAKPWNIPADAGDPGETQPGPPLARVASSPPN